MPRIQKIISLFLFSIMVLFFTVPAEASCIYNKTEKWLKVRLSQPNTLGSSWNRLEQGAKKCWTNKSGRYYVRVDPSLPSNGECHANVGAHDWVKVKPVFERNRAQMYEIVDVRCTFKDTGIDRAHEEHIRTQLNARSKWKTMLGKAIDIGAGANGSIFVIGTGPQKLYRWNKKSTKKWKSVANAGTGLRRVDVGPDGTPWVIAGNNDIFTINMITGEKTIISGMKARDIGVGANGAVWVISSTKAPNGGYLIYMRTATGWRKAPGAAIRIDVTADGYPIIANQNHNLFVMANWRFGWFKMGGMKAIDVAAGSSSRLAILNKRRQPHLWVPNAQYSIPQRPNQWNRIAGTGRNITLDWKGKPWVVNKNNRIFSWDKGFTQTKP